MGSLVICDELSSYQLAFTTPGISPFSASCRKHRRQTPYLRRNPRGRPHLQQRLRCRHCSLGVFFFCSTASLISFAIFASVAICISVSCCFSAATGPGTAYPSASEAPTLRHPSLQWL